MEAHHPICATLYRHFDHRFVNSCADIPSTAPSTSAPSSSTPLANAATSPVAGEALFDVPSMLLSSTADITDIKAVLNQAAPTSVYPGYSDRPCIRFASDFCVIRSPCTARNNISYSMVEVSEAELVDSILVGRVKQHLMPGCRGIMAHPIVTATSGCFNGGHADVILRKRRLNITLGEDNEQLDTELDVDTLR
ncbi:hypothetical protein MAM1_0273d09061 [Mucor ambiguus]|uniref:Uncharacterized protein n=1 Tax=Mucor ambiguus TaxID=91626 RepID=A0A0C9MFM7_9FUNG|nr:hypothetical protein MAM1_0273d09061 [Mucor ambiguus]